MRSREKPLREWIDRVDSVGSLGKGDGNIARSASQVEQGPRTFGQQSLEDIEELGRVGRPGGVGAGDALVSEVSSVFGTKMRRFLLHDSLGSST